MIRNLFLLAGFVFCAAWAIPSQADFTATYSLLASSPQGTQTSWYGGAVTNDGKFLYGLGHSHNTNGNNSIYAYDPATNTHANLFPNTGNSWICDKDIAGKCIAGTGRWAVLASTNPLYAFFGGPTITALSNRNNHQQFYLPARNEWWVLAGTIFYQGGTLWGGRFNLATNRWNNISKSLTEFSAGMIAGTPGWVAPNAATAVCKDLDTVVLFGGMANKTGGVRIIEPNPAGPEPYKWALASKPPIHMPAENVRENAVCVGDTVYFSTGQQRFSTGVIGDVTPVPGPFWKFHVPSRVWTRLTDGPPGGYFPTLTYDSDMAALLYYGGGTGKGSKAMWAYDLSAGVWQDLTGTTAAPQVDKFTAGFIPGFGHIYKGGRRWGGSKMVGAGSMLFQIKLARVGVAVVPVPVAAPVSAPVVVAQPVLVRPAPATTSTPTRPIPTPIPVPILQCPVGCVAVVTQPPVVIPPVVEPPSPPSPPPVVTASSFTWTKVTLPGQPKSPQGSMKHQRLVEGPGGRVWILGGDWGGGSLGYKNTGRQEVFSFDPRAPDGAWKLEAPFCGTVAAPVLMHTDERGAAWDVKRGLFWNLTGTPYGDELSCPTGTARYAKASTFDPATGKWAFPFPEKNIGYVTNGVLDNDQMVQITDKWAWHLNLETGTWVAFSLPGDAKRFNARSAKLGRSVWWLNRNEVLESYNLDSHQLSGYGVWPWPKQDGWGTAMTFSLGNKVLVIWPTGAPKEPRYAALYDPATKQWTVLDQGAGWGNAGMLHSSGKLILMGGGIASVADHNTQVWVGTLN